MKKSCYIFIMLVILSCSKDAPESPKAADLLFPERNSECTTGISLNLNSSEVTFRWKAAAHTELYELRVTNLITNVTEVITGASTSASLALLKGTPYSWQVYSTNSETGSPGISDRWNFYNAGFQTTYAPFPAEILAPASGASVIGDSEDEVVLEWRGSDVDNDIAGYEIYFSEQSPPETLLTAATAGTRTLKAAVSPNSIYYWKVVTIDRKGNTSDSGVYGFKVL